MTSHSPTRISYGTSIHGIQTRIPRALWPLVWWYGKPQIWVFQTTFASSCRNLPWQSKTGTTGWENEGCDNIHISIIVFWSWISMYFNYVKITMTQLFTNWIASSHGVLTILAILIVRTFIVGRLPPLYFGGFISQFCINLPNYF